MGLYWLEDQRKLSVGGRRRLVQLQTSQSVDVLLAAKHRANNLSNPKAFEILFAWVNRPCPLRSFHKKESRRIGVGYRDSGSTLPLHKQGRREQPNLIYLGEKMRDLYQVDPKLLPVVMDYGYLFHHVSDGWYEPDIRLVLHLRALSLVH
jgi:hypothetical protein